MPVGDHRQQRHGDDQADHARQDQHFVGLDADRVQRVDLFVELHGADLGREGAARAARDDDGGEQHAQLAQHADGDEVDHEDFRAVLARLLRGDVGNDQRDQKGDQRDDRDGGDAGFVDVPRDRGRPQARRQLVQARRNVIAGAPDEVERQASAPATAASPADPARSPVRNVGSEEDGGVAWAFPASVRSMSSSCPGAAPATPQRHPRTSRRLSQSRNAQAPARSRSRTAGTVTRSRARRRRATARRAPPRWQAGPRRASFRPVRRRELLPSRCRA